MLRNKKDKYLDDETIRYINVYQTHAFPKRIKYSGAGRMYKIYLIKNSKENSNANWKCRNILIYKKKNCKLPLEKSYQLLSISIHSVQANLYN